MDGGGRGESGDRAGVEEWGLCTKLRRAWRRGVEPRCPEMRTALLVAGLLA